MLRVFVARSDQKVQEEEEDPEALLHHEPGQHLVRSLTGPQVGLALSIIFQIETDPLEYSKHLTKFPS